MDNGDELLMPAALARGTYDENAGYDAPHVDVCVMNPVPASLLTKWSRDRLLTTGLSPVGAPTKKDCL